MDPYLIYMLGYAIVVFILLLWLPDLRATARSLAAWWSSMDRRSRARFLRDEADRVRVLSDYYAELGRTVTSEHYCRAAQRHEREARRLLGESE